MHHLILFYEICLHGHACIRAILFHSGDGPIPDDGDIRECSTSLHCSRPEAPAAKGLSCDVHGMVGAVCSHCNPLRGMFMDMHGSEQFIYYLVLLVALIKACPDIRDVYVDFACRCYCCLCVR